MLKGITGLFGTGCPNAILYRPCNWLKCVRNASLLSSVAWLISESVWTLRPGSRTIHQFCKSVLKCIRYADLYSWFLGYWVVILSLILFHSYWDTVNVVCHLSAWIMVAGRTFSSAGSWFNHLYMPKYQSNLFKWITLAYTEQAWTGNIWSRTDLGEDVVALSLCLLALCAS